MSQPAIAVDFPLRGEWTALNTPAYKVPSHGTHYFAQTYAYDFTRLSWNGSKPDGFSRKGNLSYLLGRTKIGDCFAWSQPIHCPFDGTVVAAEDGWPERRTVHLVSDLLVALKNELFFNEKKTDDYRPAAGNYIIIEGKDCFAFIAHARSHSINVKKGEKVASGQRLCDVGHSGNSTVPHLHFHLMDAADLRTANGIPCCFTRYEVFRDGEWLSVDAGMPNKLERIRCGP